MLRALYFLICVAVVGAGVFYLLYVVLFNFICRMLTSVSMNAAKNYLLNHGHGRDKEYTHKGVRLELRLRMVLFFALYIFLILFALFVVGRGWTLGFLPRWSLKIGLLGGIGVSCYFFHEKIAYTDICPCWLKRVYSHKNSNLGYFEGIWYNSFSYNLDEFPGTASQCPKLNWKYLYLELASFVIFLPFERHE